MHRRLILMRHAKSSWALPGLQDHDRPLNPRGLRDAPRMASALVQRGWAPARVHSSTARRTRETWAGMATVLTGLSEARVHFHPALYLGTLAKICDAVAGCPDDEPGPVLVLGHNPGWEQAASVLSGVLVQLTTANAILLEGTGPSWREALRGSWTLVEHLRPKHLPEP